MSHKAKVREGEDPNIYATQDPKHASRWLYQFRCPACNASGELSLPKDVHSLTCPEQCGAAFVQWRPPIGDRVALRCVNETEARIGIRAAVARVEADAAHARMAWLRREKGRGRPS